MDPILMLLSLMGLFLLVGGILSFVNLIRISRLKNEMAQANQQIQRLASLSHELGEKVQEISRRVAGRPEPAAESERPSPTHEPDEGHVPSSAGITNLPKFPAPLSQVPPSPSQETLTSNLRPSAAPPARSASPPSPVAASGPTEPHSVKPPAKARDWTQIEERLGANWLNRVGIAILVIGAAFFLNYTMQHLGRGGKAALIYALGAGLLLLGVLGERHERYRIIARAMLGGGWALLYATTYAIHNVEIVKLIESPLIGFGLLFAVAAAMVTHSLRYNSQLVTGLAYLLGFASVAVSSITIGSLAASAILAASLVMVLWQRSWYKLEPWAVVATYGLHWMWLQEVYRIQGRKPFPDLAAGTVLLAGYWLVFTVSQFLREKREMKARRFLAIAFVFNAGGFLIVLGEQSFHAEWRFAFLLILGGVYLMLAALARKMQRDLGFVLSSTLGASLTVASIPYRFSDSSRELLWLVQAEALLLTGWKILEPHLRKLGWAASAVLAVHALYRAIVQRSSGFATPDFTTAWLLLALSAAFYANSRLLPRHYVETGSRFDRIASILATPAATVLLLSAAWTGLPDIWVGPAWMLSALVIHEAGVRWKDPALRACALVTSFLSAAVLVIVNFEGFTAAAATDRSRLWTVASASLLAYFLAWRLQRLGSAEVAASLRDLLIRAPEFIHTFLSGTATLLLGLLIWYEAPPAGVGMAWGLLGVVLLEAGRARSDIGWLYQGYALLTASFVRVFVADLNSIRAPGSVAPALFTVPILAAVYYYAFAGSPPRFARIRTLLLWFPMAVLAALMRFELMSEWVVVGWAVLAAGYFLLAPRFSLPVMRYQTHVLAALVGLRCAFENFYQTSPGMFFSQRAVTVLAASLVFYSLLAVTLFRKRRGLGEVQPRTGDSPKRIVRAARWLDSHPEQGFFFIPTLLITVLLTLEVDRSYVTAAWGLLGLVVFLAVLPLGERSFRWFSLLLLFLSVARVVLVDVWTLNPLGRVVSFMGLGAAMLVVSFLYARHRETWRKFL